MRHTEIFVGRVGKIRDLVELNEGNCVVNFSIAETPRKKVNNEWVDDVTIWTDVSIWGKEARAFVKSDIGPGTQLMVFGTRTAREYDADEGKRVAQQIRAEAVGVLLTPWNYVEKVGKMNSDSYSSGSQTSTESHASQAAPKVEESQIEPDLNLGVADDGDIDLFGTGDDSEVEDLFSLDD